MMTSIDITVCDHLGRAPYPQKQQEPGPCISTFIAGMCPVDELPPKYADFAALHWVWKDPVQADIVGFMGYRKYILFNRQQGLQAYWPTAWGPPTWWDADREQFNKYRDWLSKWDGAELLPLLATHDMIVTPPFIAPEPILADFAGSRSVKDANVLRKALVDRDIYTNSRKIYPYIFVTRWSVFDRFMTFAWRLAQEVEDRCTGSDSVNEAYKKRPMAYVLERAFSLWLESSGLSFKELPILNCWEL